MCFQQSVSDLAKAVLQGLRLRFTDTHRRNLDALTAVLVDVEIKDATRRPRRRQQPLSTHYKFPVTESWRSQSREPDTSFPTDDSH
jgi:hypothetical protein